MRKLIAVAGAFVPLLLAAPVAAQPGPDPRDEEIARALPRADQIAEVGETLGRVAEALMDIPIGPIADAIDPYRRGRHRDETLGDVASRGDPYARERVRDQVEAATVGAGAAMEGIAAVTPVLRRSLEDAVVRMEDAMRRPDRSRDREERDGAR
jgi:hypothetical protein